MKKALFPWRTGLMGCPDGIRSGLGFASDGALRDRRYHFRGKHQPAARWNQVRIGDQVLIITDPDGTEPLTDLFTHLHP